MGFLDYFEPIAIILIVLFAAYYLTRLIAKSGTGAYRRSAGLKMIGSLSLGKDKAVAVVEIGKYAYVLGIGGQRVERLDKMELSELDLAEEATAPSKFSACFKNELNLWLKGNRRGK